MIVLASYINISVLGAKQISTNACVGPIHTADADATRQNSFVASASAVCIGLKV